MNQYVFIGARSALQLGEVVGVGTAQIAIDEEHDGKADAHLSRGDGEHEQREHLTVCVVERRAEGHQVDVDGHEHELDAREHQHGVPACDDAVRARAEQERREQQELVEEHQSLLASTTAPISAASSSTPMSSKGM